MPSYPLAPFVNKAIALLTSVAPRQAKVPAARVAAWQAAATPMGGITAVIGTAGARMGARGSHFYAYRVPSGIGFK